MEKEEMLALIKKADEAYYDKDSPIMEDKEYDSLREEYISKFGSEDLDYVPGNVNKEFKHFKHPYPVVSLAKVKQGENSKIIEKAKKLESLIIEPKLDGLTIVAYPVDGKYIFVTRGSGTEGDVLPNFISKYENVIPTNDWIIRGEVFITEDNFNKIKEMQVNNGETPFKNSRNAAAGILRGKERSPYIDYLTYVCYDILNSDEKHSEVISNIHNNTVFDSVAVIAVTADITVMPSCCHAVINNYETLPANLYDFYTEYLSNGIPIDGLVIKSNAENSLTKFGSTGHHPNNAFAYKTAQDTYETTITGVRWDLGRKYLTPVAIFEPVEIDNTVITNASLHNWNIISKLGGIRIGDIVEIEKANEIIPQIVRVKEKSDADIIKPPSYCPCCGGELKEENGQIFCDNDYCSEKLSQNIAYLGSKHVLDIKGMSIETARKIVNKINADNPGYLLDSTCAFLVFELGYDFIKELHGFGEKSASNLFNAIKNSIKEVDLAHAIAACCFNGIGVTVGQILEKEFKNVNGLVAGLKLGEERIKKLNGIGPIVAKTICSDNFISTFELVTKYVNIVEPKSSSVTSVINTPEKVLTFVFTGKMEYPRQHYESMIISHGHKVGSSCNSKTDYLIIADTDSTSVKAKKARDLGITLISPNDLEKYI